MGVILESLTISDKNIERLFRSPDLIINLIYPDVPKTTTSRSFTQKILSIIGIELENHISNQGKSSIQLDPKLGENERIDIDKSWHAIQFLLTGTPNSGNFPANFLIAGTSVGQVDVGYGPANCFTSKQVKEIDKYLSTINRAKLLKSWDAKKMTDAEIYPQIWDRIEDAEINKQYILTNFDNLKEYINRAASNKLGIILWMD